MATEEQKLTDERIRVEILKMLEDMRLGREDMRLGRDRLSLDAAYYKQKHFISLLTVVAIFSAAIGGLVVEAFF